MICYALWVLGQANNPYIEVTAPHKLRCAVTQNIVFGSDSLQKPAEVYAAFGLPSSEGFQKVLKINLPNGMQLVKSEPTGSPIGVISGSALERREQKIVISFDVEARGVRAIPEECEKITWSNLQDLSPAYKHWLKPEPIVESDSLLVRSYVRKLLGPDFK